MINTRRRFLADVGVLAASSLTFVGCSTTPAVAPTGPESEGQGSPQPQAQEPNAQTSGPQDLGLQLYTFRDDMAKDPLGTLEVIAALGVTQIETARSDKGHYYGLSPREMKARCAQLGMTLRSGHVHIDENWSRTMDEALESGQEYLVCSSMASREPSLDNFKRTAELFNKSGEQCKARGLKFGYHNHTYEFQSVGETVLYELLLEKTQPDLVGMELDLGWVVAAGKNPVDYFNKYPGRFPLWHLKDMNVAKQQSTEFGLGALNVAQMMKLRATSGVEHIFIEQEKYASTPLESMRHNMKYLAEL